MISGEYFLEGAEVFFDGVPVRVIRIDASQQQLEVFTPPGRDAVSVRVTNTSPRRLPSENTLTYTYIREGTPFTRGDSNGDSEVDISDAVHILGALFLGEGFLDCELASDANGSGFVDLSDAVAILSFLFQGTEGSAGSIPRLRMPISRTRRSWAVPSARGVDPWHWLI